MPFALTRPACKFAVTSLLIVIAFTGTAGAAVRDFGYFGGDSGWLWTDSALYVRSYGAWQRVEPLGLPASAILGVRFLDRDHGWALIDLPFGEARLQVASTANGGASWTTSSLPIDDDTAATFSQAELAAADPDHVWLLVRKTTGPAFSVASLFASNDGGRHWNRLPEPPTFGRFTFTSATRGWMAGGAAMKQLWSSRDGGRTWTEASLDTGEGSFRAAPAFDGDRGAVVISRVVDDRAVEDVLSTADGGATWTLAARAPRDAVTIERATASAVALPSQAMSSASIVTRPWGWSATSADFASPEDGWVFERSVTCDRASFACADRQALRETRGSGDSVDVMPEAERLYSFPRVESTLGSGDGFDMASQGSLQSTQMASLFGSGFSIIDSASGKAYSGTLTNMAVYLGGASAGATAPTAKFLQDISTQGWGLLPLWVPSQAPCTAGILKKSLSYSDDPVAKGNEEGSTAVATAQNYGLGSGAVIWLDIEAFVQNSKFPACNSNDTTLMKRFVSTLFNKIRQAGFKAGLYTSASNANVWTSIDSNLASTPDTLWMAYYGRNRFDMGSFLSTGWYQDKRAHQFANVAHGVLNFQTDYDAVNAQVESVGGTPAPTVAINSVSTSPSITGTSSTFTISYSVTASAATSVMLGASLRPQGTTSWTINDPSHDRTVSLTSGANTVTRQFTVSAAAGVYDLLVAVWRDVNGSGTIDGGDQQLAQSTLLNAETLSNSTCYGLTIVRSPTSGGSVTANPATTVPCNVNFYLTGTPISLTAQPASGYQFTGWTATGGSLSSQSQLNTTFTITGTAQVTAAFTATPACSYSIAPSSASGAGGGGTSSVQVTGGPTGCTGSWSASASSSGNWLVLSGTTGQNGAGSWPVAYTYSANPSTTSTRSGTVSFNGSFPSGSTFTLTQNPSTPGACSYSVTPSSANVSSASGSNSVQVTGSPSGCSGSWTATPSSSGGWLSLPGTASGSGAGAVQVPYAYTANPSTASSRSGSIVFSGSFTSTFTLTQDAAPVSGGGNDAVIDGGFESATSSGNSAPGWTVVPALGHTVILKGTDYPHSGTNNARLGGSSSTVDILEQTITIPSNASAASLTFWVNVVTQEWPGYPYDFLYVDLYDANGIWLTNLRVYTNEDSGGTNNIDGAYFKAGPIDLSAYKGSSVQLVFEAFTDDTLATTFRIDDVSLQTTSTCTPPAITQHPASVTINAGQSAQLSVTASGTGPFTYAWYQMSGNTAVPVGTNSGTLNVAPSATSQYFVWVSNSCNAALSNLATVTVNPVCGPLSITSQPAATTISAGQSTTLSVTASGTAPLTYYWYRIDPSGSVLIQNGPSASLTVSPSATTDYFVWVYGGCGTSALSNVARVTVPTCTGPAITTQPGSVSTLPGQSTTLTVAATGTAPLAYYWYRIGTIGSVLVQSGSSPSLLVAPTQTTDYFVWVYGSCGTPQQSNVARVTVTCAPPSIAAQPASVSILPGQSTTLIIGANGTAPLAYYWYRIDPAGSVLVQAGTSPSLLVAPAQTTDYFAWVYGCGAPAQTNVARVTVSCTLASITTQPLSTQIGPGQSTVLSVTATGSGPFAYYWYRIGSNGSVLVQSGNSASLVVAPTQTTDYFVWVYGACNATVSNVARVTVICTPAAVALQPANLVSQPGQQVQLTTAGSGSSPFTYEWYQLTPSGSLRVGTNSPTLTVAPVTTTQYFAWIYNACGASITNLATVTVQCTPVSYTAQPLNVTMNAGQTAQLSVSVAGTGSFTYQWYQLGPNGSILIPNATSSAQLFSPSVTTQYFVWSYNACGAAISNLVTVTVR